MSSSMDRVLKHLEDAKILRRDAFLLSKKIRFFLTNQHVFFKTVINNYNPENTQEANAKLEVIKRCFAGEHQQCKLFLTGSFERQFDEYVKLLNLAFADMSPSTVFELRHPKYVVQSGETRASTTVLSRPLKANASNKIHVLQQFKQNLMDLMTSKLIFPWLDTLLVPYRVQLEPNLVINKAQLIDSAFEHHDRRWKWFATSFQQLTSQLSEYLVREVSRSAEPNPSPQVTFQLMASVDGTGMCQPCDMQHRYGSASAPLYCEGLVDRQMIALKNGHRAIKVDLHEFFVTEHKMHQHNDRLLTGERRKIERNLAKLRFNVKKALIQREYRNWFAQFVVIVLGYMRQIAGKLADYEELRLPANDIKVELDRFTGPAAGQASSTSFAQLDVLAGQFVAFAETFKPYLLKELLDCRVNVWLDKMFATLVDPAQYASAAAQFATKEFEFDDFLQFGKEIDQSFEQLTHRYYKAENRFHSLLEDDICRVVRDYFVDELKAIVALLPAAVPIEPHQQSDAEVELTLGILDRCIHANEDYLEDNFSVMSRMIIQYQCKQCGQQFAKKCSWNVHSAISGHREASAIYCLRCYEALSQQVRIRNESIAREAQHGNA